MKLFLPTYLLLTSFCSFAQTHENKNKLPELSYSHNDYKELGSTKSSDTTKYSCGYFWDELDEKWILNMDFKTSYNSVGDPIEKFNQMVDTFSTARSNLYHEYLSYDNSGNLTQIESFDDWDPIAQEYLYRRKEQYYYDNANLSEMLYFIWLPEYQTYAIDSKTSFTHDLSNLEITSTYHKWYSPDWTVQYVDSLFYDVLGNLTEEKKYIPGLFVDPITNQYVQWALDEKILHTYNASGNVIFKRISYFQNNESTSYFEYLNSYLYDGQDNLTEDIRQSRNAGSVLWTNQSKQAYSYITEFQEEHLRFNWDSNANGWVLQGLKSVSDYDMFGALNKLEYFLLSEDNFTWDQEYVWYYNSVTNCDNLYSEELSIDEDLKTPINAKIVIFPNPASTVITIDTKEEIESVMIFDFRGSLMQTTTSEMFSIENLSTGIYFANVKTISGVSRVRFVKE